MSENYMVSGRKQRKLEKQQARHLKPCPICGGEVVFTGGGSLQLQGYAVRCPECCFEFGYDRQRGGIFPTPEKATQAWNRRAKIA